MSRPRVLLVSTLYAPFQVEVADAVNRAGVLDYHICFTQRFREERGKHWLAELEDRPEVHCATGSVQPADWVRTVLDEVKPDLCISGFYRGAVYDEIIRYQRRCGATVGFWGEQLFPGPRPKMWVKELLLRMNLSDVDFVFAIGDRAYRQFSTATSSCRTHLVPYGQDLGVHSAIEHAPIDRPVRFLFSGRLVPQHNIAALCAALAAVADRRPDSFTFTCAARGPEERFLAEAMRLSAALSRAVSYDRDYESWTDRIRPFGSCDVLLYPSFHAGWGLVVPEAMASAMLVVASHGVESARYFITPGVDGLMIGTKQREIERAIEWCIDHPREVREMGLRARGASWRGSADYVAGCLAQIVPAYL